MIDYLDFESVFGTESFVDRSQATEAEGLRKGLEGALFIDRVLRTLGITKSKIYPPKSHSALRSFHKEVCEANMSTHHRLSILFYTLLDLAPQRRANDLADTFADATGLPKRYQTFMKGLYYLDKHQFTRALDYITHPSLIPDFSDDIVTVLALNAPAGDYTLVLTYFHTVQPVIKSASTLEILFDAMAKTSVSQSLVYSRTQSETTRELLFCQLIASVLDGAGNPSGASRAAELVGSVFEKCEEEWFEEFLTHGAGKNLKKARDTLFMRKIATGRYQEAIAERGISSQWGGVVEGVTNGLGGRSS